MSSVIELLSPLPLDECRRLLQEHVDGTMTFFGTRAVEGSINGTRLRANKRIGYRNSFQTRLVADLTEEAGHTRITCRFSMHPFVVVFLVVWFGGVLSAAGGLSLIPLGMAACGVALVGIGRYFARGEREFLIDFVCNTLSARPA